MLDFDFVWDLEFLYLKVSVFTILKREFRRWSKEFCLQWEMLSELSQAGVSPGQGEGGG